jgi:hypothetical protein
VSDRKRSRQRPLSQIFAVPFALGVVSTAGLIVALVGDGVWDALGWLGLGIPLIVTAWCLWRRRVPA